MKNHGTAESRLQMIGVMGQCDIKAAHCLLGLAGKLVTSSQSVPCRRVRWSQFDCAHKSRGGVFQVSAGKFLLTQRTQTV
jgi:hypothetical protein